MFMFQHAKRQRVPSPQEEFEECERVLKILITKLTGEFNKQPLPKKVTEKTEPNSTKSPPRKLKTLISIIFLPIICKCILMEHPHTKVKGQHVIMWGKL